MIINQPTIFTPFPSVQATNLIVTELSDTQLRVTGTRGNGISVLVVARLSTSVQRIPRDQQTYTANSVFGAGSNLGDGNYVVAKGTTINVLVTGLTELTGYVFQAYEFNSVSDGFEQYNVNSATGNPVSTTTTETPEAPSTQATNLQLLGLQTVDMTRGDGMFVLLLKNESGAINGSFLPVDGQTYTIGQDLGGGNIVVGKGTASRYDVGTLPYDQDIAFRAFEFNVAGGEELYNLSTATGNPITPHTQVQQNWYSYKDTPFLTRRSPFNLSTQSREFSQLYPTADWIGSTHHHVWLVSEGDGSRLTGIDRTIRYKRALGDDPTVKANWVKDSPVDAWGDTPSFLDSSALQYPLWVSGSYDNGERVYVNPSPAVLRIFESTADGNTTNPIGGSNWTEIDLFDRGQCWMMSVVEHGGNQYGVYVANRYPGSRYSVGVIVSDDEFETYTRLSSPIIPDSGTFSAYYCHVHPTKVGSYWYMFVQNYYPAGLVEDHLYVCEIWRTSSDPNPSGWSGWTKISTGDVLSGRGYSGAVDISTSWEEGGKFYAFISPNDTGEDGGYNAKREGQTPAFKSTFPVGNKILLISWTDWTTFKDTHIVEREIYRTEQMTEIELRTWCPMREFDGNKFFVGMGFLWRGQTNLNGIQQVEPKNDGKIISRSLNLTGGVQVRNEIYPDYIHKLFLPHRSFVNDVLGSTPNPFDVLADTAGTVIGSPGASFFNCIQPKADGDGVTFPNFSYSSQKFAVKIIVGENTLTSAYAVVGMLNGWYIVKSGQYNFEVWIFKSGDVSQYKRYRFSTLGNKANNDATLLNMVGFEWNNGTLKCRLDYNLDVTTTKVVDHSFTDMHVSSGVINFGTLHPSLSSDYYSKDVVGPCLILSGDNVTDNNYLNNNLIGY